MSQPQRSHSRMVTTGGITGGAGDDIISGGDGDDVAVYSGKMSDYRLDLDAGTITDSASTLDGDDGTDTFSEIETVRFKDGEVTFSSQTEGEFQVYVFSGDARPVVPGSEGRWLDASDVRLSLIHI